MMRVRSSCERGQVSFAILGMMFPLLGLATLVISFFTSDDAPLKSSRPGNANTGTKYDVPAPDGVQSTFARLWEDPLDAIERIEPPDDCMTVEVCAQQAAQTVQGIAMNIHRLTERPLLIMPVFVSGAPYIANKEDRQRARYALHSALGSQGFTLSFPERMSVITLNPEIDLAASRLKKTSEGTLPAGRMENAEPSILR